MEIMRSKDEPLRILYIWNNAKYIYNIIWYNLICTVFPYGLNTMIKIANKFIFNLILYWHIENLYCGRYDLFRISVLWSYNIMGTIHSIPYMFFICTAYVDKRVKNDVCVYIAFYVSYVFATLPQHLMLESVWFGSENNV